MCDHGQLFKKTFEANVICCLTGRAAACGLQHIEARMEVYKRDGTLRQDYFTLFYSKITSPFPSTQYELKIILLTNIALYLNLAKDRQIGSRQKDSWIEKTFLKSGKRIKSLSNLTTELILTLFPLIDSPAFIVRFASFKKVCFSTCFLFDLTLFQEANGSCIVRAINTISGIRSLSKA